MIVEFGTIENAYVHLEEIKPNKARESLREHYDLAELSKALATINTEVRWNMYMKRRDLGIFILRKRISSVNSWNLKIFLEDLILQLYRRTRLSRIFLPAVILEAQKHCLRSC